MKMRRTIWLTLAVAINAIFAAVSQAQTNSCISSTDGFWDEARLWSLAVAPSIALSAILITNDASETVTIDSITANSFTSTLTISNLDISPFSAIDTLYLDNTGTVALHILNSLTIGNVGGPPGGVAVLISTNSTIIVDGLLGGQLQNNGTMVITGGSLITTNCSLQVGVPANNNYPGLLIVSNAVVQARDVSLGEYSRSGTIEIIGGTMTLSSSLQVGGYFQNSQGSVLVANGGLLVVTNGPTFFGIGGMTVSTSRFLAADVYVSSIGADLTINDGTVTVDGSLNIGTGDRADGSVSLNGGMLIVTNNITNLGSYPGIGRLTVSDGLYLGQGMFLLESSLSIQGGTSILSSNMDLSFGAAIYVSGGQLFVTNAPISIFGGSWQSTVSGGLLAANSIDLGTGTYGGGTLSINGGSATASTGITLGDCVLGNPGYLIISGGQLIVTNAAHTGFIDVQNGQLVLSGGV
jgi:hypothetical protein